MLRHPWKIEIKWGVEEELKLYINGGANYCANTVHILQQHEQCSMVETPAVEPKLNKKQIREQENQDCVGGLRQP